VSAGRDAGRHAHVDAHEHTLSRWKEQLAVDPNDERVMCCGQQMRFIAEAGEDLAWRQLWRCSQCEQAKRMGWISTAWGIPIPYDDVILWLAQEFGDAVEEAYTP
jgi:hypothetical protein